MVKTFLLKIYLLIPVPITCMFRSCVASNGIPLVQENIQATCTYKALLKLEGDA